MRTEVYEVSAELSDAIQSRQIRLEGLKDLLGFCYSTTSYNIPKDKVRELEQEYIDVVAEYNLLKEQVEAIFIKEFNPANTSWNLDFHTKKVTVVENDNE